MDLKIRSLKILTRTCSAQLSTKTGRCLQDLTLKKKTTYVESEKVVSKESLQLLSDQTVSVQKHAHLSISLT